MKNITKAENKAYFTQAVNTLLENGATKTTNYGLSDTWQGLENTYKYVSDVFGTVYFIVDNDNTNCYSLYIRFDSDENARKYCNYTETQYTHTGKYNVHDYSSSRPLHVLENVLFELTLTELEYIEFLLAS